MANTTSQIGQAQVGSAQLGGGVVTAPVVPATMTANAGTTPQNTLISTAFPVALGVTLLDAMSNPVPGIPVVFTAPASGASGVFSSATNTITVTSNASGVATAPFTANSIAGGPYVVTADSSGLATINFSLTNNHGPAAVMTALAGSTPQSAIVGNTFSVSIGVTVTDASSNPVPGVSVTLTAPGGGASGLFTASGSNVATVFTNVLGVASSVFTANSTVGGPYTVTAAATALATVNFSLTNITLPTPGTFPEFVTGNAGFSVSNTLNNPGSMGPWPNGNTDRYLILLNPVTLKLGAYKTTNNGVTWTEVDNAHAPTTKANDARTWEYFGVTRDSNPAIKNLYVVYWHTDSTLRLITFDMSAGTWGAQVTSALSYQFANQLGSNFDTGFGIAHRAADNTVWVALQSGWDGLSPFPHQRVVGAKCAVTGAGWDGAYTALGDSSLVTSWGVVGMVTDSTGAIQCIWRQNASGPGPFITVNVAHQVIHADNSLSALDTVIPGVGSNFLGHVTYPTISATDEILFTAVISGDFTITHTLRGQAGDAPVWEDLTPFTGNLQNQLGCGTTNINGLDYLFYLYPDTVTPTIYQYVYITSSGIGIPWSLTETPVGSFDPAHPVPSGSVIGKFLYAAKVPQAAGPVWALAMNYISTATTTSGAGYWELYRPTVVVIPRTGGGKTPRKCGNWWDECLHDKADFIGVLDWTKITQQVPRCFRNPDPDCDIPMQGQQIRRQNAITRPTDDGTDYLILSYKVPSGYTGIFTDHTQMFLGTGFQEGSGSITWRLRIDTWWVKDMGNMTTTRGSLNYLFPIPTGLIVQGGQTVYYYVNIAVGAGAFLNTGKVIVGLNGWIYPEDEYAVNYLLFDQRKLKQYYRSDRAKQRIMEKGN